MVWRVEEPPATERDQQLPELEPEQVPGQLTERELKADVAVPYIILRVGL